MSICTAWQSLNILIELLKSLHIRCLGKSSNKTVVCSACKFTGMEKSKFWIKTFDWNKNAAGYLLSQDDAWNA